MTKITYTNMLLGTNKTADAETVLDVPARTISVSWIAGAALAAVIGLMCVLDRDTAVSAPATVETSMGVTTVAFVEGGPVKEVLARKGQPVRKGSVIAKADPIQAEAELARKRVQIGHLKAQAARLKAQADGADAMPQNVQQADGTTLFDPKDYDAEKAVFDADRKYLSDTISGFKDKITAAERERSNYQAQAGQFSALARNTAGVSGFLTQQQNAAASAAGAAASASRLDGEIANAKSEIIKVQQKAKAEALEKLSGVQAEIEKTVKEVEASRDRYNRTDIVSPVDGIIKEMYVTQAGEVVPPNGKVAEIVPTDKLVVEAEVDPKDVRDLTPGMPAKVRLSAFDVARFGHVEGKLEGLSPATQEDRRSGKTYYTARIVLEQTEIGGRALLPGMKADVSILTGEQKLISYFMNPVISGAGKAFTEARH